MRNNLAWSCAIIIALLVVGSCTDPTRDGSGRTSTSKVFNADGIIAGTASSSSSSQNGDSTIHYEAGVITAGEWNDNNNNWTFWNSLMANQDYKTYLTSWMTDTKIRLPFIVKDLNNQNLIDAVLEVKDADGASLWTCRVDNFGKAIAWPSFFSNGSLANQITITYQSNVFTYKNYFFNPDVNLIKVPIVRDQIVNADIALVVDGTGSMGDELEYLKVEMNDVLAKAAQNNCSQWHVASVFYRDAGDEYVTRVQPFTNSIPSVIDFIKKQTADGGGDWPEAVHSGLDASINDLDWSVRARARLLFLVLDAPPHKQPDIIEKLTQHIKAAAAKGIKIIPIVASGIDKETEFLMRSWSLATNGTYVFITNDSGIGNDHLTPTVGNYTVEKLNALMTRLIYQYTSCSSE